MKTEELERLKARISQAETYKNQISSLECILTRIDEGIELHIIVNEFINHVAEQQAQQDNVVRVKGSLTSMIKGCLSSLQFALEEL